MQTAQDSKYQDLLLVVGWDVARCPSIQGSPQVWGIGHTLVTASTSLRLSQATRCCFLVSPRLMATWGALERPALGAPLRGSVSTQLCLSSSASHRQMQIRPARPMGGADSLHHARLSRQPLPSLRPLPVDPAGRCQLRAEPHLPKL